MIRDHMLKKRARKAALEYIRGANLRGESEELSDKVLAGKFACHASTIRKVRKHLPVTALETGDQELIRQCAAEKARIDDQLPQLSKEYLARHYDVSAEAIDIELQLLGWEDPRLKRKNRKAAA